MTVWSRPFARISLAFMAMVCAAGLALGYEVEPMRLILDLGSNRTSTVISITNTRDARLPVEIVMKRRIVNPDGSQEFVPADEDFSVFPPLALIEPGQSQAVRLTYIGDPGITDSQAYIAEVQEVPVNQPGFTGVVFAYNFGVAVYLRADEAEADVSLTEIRREDDGLHFRAVNDGTDFAMLSDMSLRISIGSESIRLEPAQLSELIENPIIPPHAVRDFHLAITDLPDGDLRISLD
ncbi:molecular chaperone [Maricaulis parjimensis]|uniref:fimbrial biogenesis chaperone n=1 Tax=Maricaulis parjimensis TaxID=144023 RepID=UPI00193AAC55|nr:fimbria/pilus periplasmic chaperone [Maricaulis parjimensis]